MSKVKIVLKKELRETFRDKKSLLMMLVIPIMIPIIIIFMSYIFNSTMDKDINSYNKIGFTYSLSSIEKELIKDLNIKEVVDTKDNLDKKIAKDEINAYIEKIDNKYIITAKSSEDATFALSLSNTFLEQYKIRLQANILADSNIDPNEVLNVIEIETNKIEEDNFMAKYLISYTFLFIIMAITTSSTYPATDATAGERERGTLETLLTFPIKSKDIIIGKFLSVSISSMITGVLSLVLSIITLKSLPLIFDYYKDINLNYSIPMIIVSILIIILYSLFISGLSIAIASKAKSFKEAQSSLTPLNFISFFPGMIAFFAQVKTTWIISLIPFINYSLVFTDISNNTFDYLNIILMFISTIVLISVVLYIIIKQYTSEKVLFNS